MSETRELLTTAEGQLRRAALSLRSLCEHNQGATLTVVREDGYTLRYVAGDGLEVTDTADKRIAFYPEAELDVERWAAADFTARKPAPEAAR